MPSVQMPNELDPERRGLAAPRPAGGLDPDPAATARAERRTLWLLVLRAERRTLWLLVLMIALIVGVTTIVGIVGMIVVALGGTT